MRNAGIIACGMSLSLGVLSASAVNMAPGAFVSPLPGTSVAAEPQLAGTVVEDGTQTYSGTFTTTNEPWQVEVNDRVIHADDGTYDFYFRITVLQKPAVYPMTVSRDGFAGLSTNVSWRTDFLGTVNPSSGSRTADGDTILWDYGFNMPVNQLTKGIFVDTQATSYALNSEAVIDFSPSFNVNGRAIFAAFGPAVPEPVSLASIALGTLMFRRTRRG